MACFGESLAGGVESFGDGPTLGKKSSQAKVGGRREGLEFSLIGSSVLLCDIIEADPTDPDVFDRLKMGIVIFGVLEVLTLCELSILATLWFLFKGD